jgi:hypothetical protein
VEIAVPIAIGVVVLLLLVVVLVGAASRGAARRKDVVDDPHVETLRYVVPPGQDPAALVAALERAGYTATAEPSPEGHELEVACTEGRDRHRARVRSVIEQAGRDQHDNPVEVPDVRFRDEQQA